MACHDVPVLGDRMDDQRCSRTNPDRVPAHPSRPSAPGARQPGRAPHRGSAGPIRTDRPKLASLPQQETGPLLDAVPPVDICLDRFGQLGQIDRAVQLEELPWAEVGEHLDGDRLFSVAGRAAQDDGAVLPECGSNIVQPVRRDECAHAPARSGAGSQAPKPDSLRSADQEDVLVAADRIARYGQALSFPQVFITQRALPRTRGRLRRGVTGADTVVFRLRLSAAASFRSARGRLSAGGDQEPAGGASADGPPPGGGGPAGPPGAGGVVMAPAADRPALTQR